jgi:hypothetical protein
MENNGSMNWKDLNARLGDMTEAELLGFLNHEVCTSQRATHIVRLHQRYCKLRDAREREEALAGNMV